MESEKIWKEIIRHASEEIVRKELQEIEQNIEKEGKMLFSESYRRKMNEVIYGQEKKAVFLKGETQRIKIQKRYIAIMLLLLILCTSTVLANDNIREKLGDIYYTVFADNVEIRKVENVKEANLARSEEIIAMKPTYIPEGYEVYEENCNEEVGRYGVIWMTKDENILNYIQYNISNTNISVTSDGSIPENVKIGNVIGKYVIDNDGIATLFYEDGQFVYIISGTLPKEELIKILASVE